MKARGCSRARTRAIISTSTASTSASSIGITSRPARHAALLALAAHLPAPILAERLGIHPARAAQWARLAGAPYADYVALRHST
jgi:hypothetical protein